MREIAELADQFGNKGMKELTNSINGAQYYGLLVRHKECPQMGLGVVIRADLPAMHGEQLVVFWPDSLGANSPIGRFSFVALGNLTFCSVSEQDLEAVK